jgi:periplasmic copper chaperone A
MKTTLPAFAVISTAACLTTTMPAAFAFGIATRAANVSTTRVVSTAAAEQSYKLGQLVIEAPWARATPEGAQVGGGYLKITNTGKAADRLIGGSLPVATSVEVHQMSMSDGVMKMRKMDRGLEIKPGQTVELKPGGYHLMFNGLREGLKQGQTIKGTLQFEKAGSIEVEFQVAPIGAKGAQTGGHMHMQH